MAGLRTGKAEKGDLIGGAWLCKEYGIELVQPLRYESRIGSASQFRNFNGNHQNTYQPAYAPENSLAGHLAFLLKYEAVHLELFSRLFAIAGQEELTEWLEREPTGAYARRAAWLFEWLTGQKLDLPDLQKGNYVNLLDPDKYWVTNAERLIGKNKRFRINDNLAGWPAFCPMVRLDDRVKAALNEINIGHSLAGLEQQFGADLLKRAAVWLTIKESRSSFKIEGEHDPDREERFAASMEQHLGRLADPLVDDLSTLQKDVLGPKALHYGLRQSPIFVGEMARYQHHVHYIAPPFKHIPDMVEALAGVYDWTEKTDPIIRAAVLSFGFVYLHPLSDGNGRISRFIINDVLRRDGILPDYLVLPVSATICRDRLAYDRILDVFSEPFRHKYAGSWRFGKDQTYPDGQISNLEFDHYDDALHAWRYPDLTEHVIYLAGVIKETLATEMVEEAELLRRHYQMRERLNRVIQAGDNALDRIIRSVLENKSVSGKLKAEYSLLQDPDIEARVVEAVLQE